MQKKFSFVLFDRVKKTEQEKHVNTTCFLFKFWVDHIIMESVVNPKFKKAVYSAAKINIYFGERIMKYCKKSIAISIAILFPPSIAIAIAIFFVSIANNPDCLNVTCRL